MLHARVLALYNLHSLMFCWSFSKAFWRMPSFLILPITLVLVYWLIPTFSKNIWKIHYICYTLILKKPLIRMYCLLPSISQHHIVAHFLKWVQLLLSSPKLPQKWRVASLFIRSVTGKLSWFLPCIFHPFEAPIMQWARDGHQIKRPKTSFIYWRLFLVNAISIQGIIA